jgi:hypothetical protein
MTKQIDLHVLKILSSIFLPSGYPTSVSPGKSSLQELMGKLIKPFRLSSVRLDFSGGSSVNTLRKLSDLQFSAGVLQFARWPHCVKSYS